MMESPIIRMSITMLLFVGARGRFGGGGQRRVVVVVVHCSSCWKRTRKSATEIEFVRCHKKAFSCDSDHSFARICFFVK
jgi:hypothetical protein